MLSLPLCAGARAYSCDESACKSPDCMCPSTKPPGGLSPKDIPQFVLISVCGAPGWCWSSCCCTTAWLAPAARSSCQQLFPAMSCAAHAAGLRPAFSIPHVMPQHDDSVNQLQNRVVRAVTDGFKNPNGCNVPATWWACHACGLVITTD